MQRGEHFRQSCLTHASRTRIARFLLVEDSYKVRVNAIQLQFDQLRQVAEAQEMQGAKAAKPNQIEWDYRAPKVLTPP